MFWFTLDKNLPMFVNFFLDGENETKQMWMGGKPRTGSSFHMCQLFSWLNTNALAFDIYLFKHGCISEHYLCMFPTVLLNVFSVDFMTLALIASRSDLLAGGWGLCCLAGRAYPFILSCFGFCDHRYWSPEPTYCWACPDAIMKPTPFACLPFTLARTKNICSPTTVLIEMFSMSCWFSAISLGRP